MNIIYTKNNQQIFRFIISGLIASGINFLVYNVLFVFFGNIVIASFLGYSVGLLCSFFFAKIWVFRNKSKKRVIKSFFIFCLIYFLGGLEMSVIIVLMKQIIDNYKIAWLFGAFFASLNNYVGSKFLLFKD